MPTETLIVPVLNDKVTTFKAPTWDLAPQQSFERMSSDYRQAFAKGTDDQHAATLKANTPCICIRGLTSSVTEDQARSYWTALGFLLNLFRGDSPAVISFGFTVIGRRRPRLSRFFAFEPAADTQRLRPQPFFLRPGTEARTVSAFYTVLEAALRQKPSLRLTLSRFNSALTRYAFEDKVVDIVVCLESLIDAETEVSFHFALYNTLTSRREPGERKDTFDLLKTLYNTRSAIVHGKSLSQKTRRQTVDRIQQRWLDVVKIAADAVVYHAFYLYKNGAGGWSRHLKRLALGIASRADQSTEA